MVKVINSGFGGYTQGGPLQISAPSPSATPTNERFTAGLTNYPGLVTPVSVLGGTVPTVAPFWQVDWTRDTGVPQQIVSSRTSSATFYNASGYRASAASDALRLEYDPNTGVPLGVLIEDQRTNLLKDSGNQTTANWGTNGIVRSTSSTLSANNSSFMTLLSANSVAAGGFATIYNPLPLTIGFNANQELSADFKKTNWNYVYLNLESDAAAAWLTIIIDLSTNTVTQTAVGGSSGTFFGTPTVKLLANGIVRVSFVGNIFANTGYLQTGFAGAATGNTFTSAGGLCTPALAGTETFLFDAAQFSPGSTATSYIPTTSAAVTRSADIPSSTDSGLLSAKAWIIETGEMAASTAATLLGINTGIGLGATSGNALTTADGGTQTTTDTGTWPSQNRAGLAWDSTPRVSIVLDGGTVVTAANTPTTPTTLYFGNTNAGASGFLNGHIRSIAAYNSLSDTDLDTLSVVGSPYFLNAPTTSAVAASSSSNVSSVVGTWTQAGAASSAGVNTSTVTATWKQDGAASSAGTNTSTVTATWKQEGVASSVGTNVSAVTATWKQNGVASSAGTNTSTVTATWLQAGVAASVGTNTSSVVSAPIQSMVATSSGANTSTAVGSWLQSGVASSVGTNTAAVTATWKQEGVAASSGANTSAVTATWLQSGVASSSGANTSSAVSAPIQSMVASSVGANTSAAVGSWLQSGVASSVGANAALVTAQWGQAGVANSAGTNLSSAYSAALPGVASSAGENTASAVGKWTQAGVASSVGTSTASAVGKGFQSGVASSVGSSVSAASGAWIQAGVATSATKELSDLLMETSGNLLMEDGFKILLDEGSDVTVRTNVFGAWTQSISLDFNQDFSNDFGVSGVGSTLLDFNRDFSNDFAVYRIGTRVTVSGTAVSVGSSIVSIVGAGGQAASLDFNRDFSGDFAVFGVTGADQGVAESAGSNIAAAVGSWEVIEAPPVYPPPEPVIKQWVPANEFQRVQQPRADRVYRTAPELRRVQPLTATRTFRTGTELRRVAPSNMKRRYG